MEVEFGEFVRKYETKGLVVLGNSCNDVDTYPDDAPEQIVAQSRRAEFTFPYLDDESQQVALEFKATCTADLFLFDKDRKLAYRGQFDELRPSNGLEPTGHDLRLAADLLLLGKRVPEPYVPSVGCGLKWKQGNEPLAHRPHHSPRGSSACRTSHLEGVPCIGELPALDRRDV